MEQLEAILQDYKLFNHIIFLAFGLLGMVGMFANIWAEHEEVEIGLFKFLFGNSRNVIKALFYFSGTWLALASSGIIDSQTSATDIMILAIGSGAAVARDFKKLGKPRSDNAKLK